MRESKGVRAMVDGYVTDQGSHANGGWACDKPGVSGKGGGYVRDQGVRARGWVCERSGVSRQELVGK